MLIDRHETESRELIEVGFDVPPRFARVVHAAFTQMLDELRSRSRRDPERFQQFVRERIDKMGAGRNGVENDDVLPPRPDREIRSHDKHAIRACSGQPRAMPAPPLIEARQVAETTTPLLPYGFAPSVPLVGFIPALVLSA